RDVGGDDGGGERRPTEGEEAGEGLSADGGERGGRGGRAGQRDFARDRRFAAVREGGRGLRVADAGEADVDGDHAGAGGDDDLAPHGGVAGHGGLDGVGAFGEAD